MGEQEAGVTSRSGWNLWVWLKEVYRFPHSTYLLLLHFFKMFFVLVDNIYIRIGNKVFR